MHHYFSRSLNFLETVKSDIVEVASTIQISLLVPHNLFEETVTSSFPLLLLKKQIVC